MCPWSNPISEIVRPFISDKIKDRYTPFAYSSIEISIEDVKAGLFAYVIPITIIEIVNNE